MFQIYIGFGSNLGDVVANFQMAQMHLKAVPEIVNFQSSKPYLTEPLTRGKNSKEVQNKYLNAVFGFETQLQIKPLFLLLQNLEVKMGRNSGKGLWQPRTVDLDLLFYGDVIFLDNDLQIPHPQLHLRRFVLEPLSEIAPDWIHPEFDMPIKKLLALCDDPLQVWPYSL